MGLVRATDGIAHAHNGEGYRTGGQTKRFACLQYLPSRKVVLGSTSALLTTLDVYFQY